MRTALVLLLLFQLSANVSAQETYYTPTDARSISMGESFAALDRNALALFYNPACLANIHGIQLSYSQRQFEWNQFTKGTKYNFFNVAVATPIANIAFSYNRFELGKVEYSNPSGVVYKVSNPFHYTFALGASHSFENGVSVGIAAKLDDFSESVGLMNSAGGSTELSMSSPIIFDLGFLFTTTLASTSSCISDRFSIGVSLQNFGTDRILQENGKTLSREQLDRFLRVGLTYSAGSVAENGLLNPIQATASIDYRRILNNHAVGRSDFYGFGFEATAFEVAVVRVGGTMSNIRNIYGRPKEIAFRYGFGIHAPLGKLGVDFPFVLQFDYAAIPVNKELAYASLYNFKTTSLGVFTFTLQYTNDVF